MKMKFTFSEVKIHVLLKSVEKDFTDFSRAMISHIIRKCYFETMYGGLGEGATEMYEISLTRITIQ